MFKFVSENIYILIGSTVATAGFTACNNIERADQAKLAVKSSLTYTVSESTYTKDVPITPNAPQIAGDSKDGFSYFVSPALPAGIALAPGSGVISGTPSIPSSMTSYTVTAKSSNQELQSVLSIAVIATPNALPGISFSENSFTFVRGQAITKRLPASTGGAITGCTAAPTLPTGLTLSASTCELNGTPTVVLSSTTYRITPANALGSGSSVPISIEIQDIAPTIRYSGPYVFTNGQASTALPSLTAGAPTRCVVSPQLPAGLSLSSTCVVSGTPSAVSQSASYTITPGNSGGNGTPVSISITVREAPPTALSFGINIFNLNKNSAMTTVSSTHSGGTVVTCSASPTLPAGVSLTVSSGECRLSGTPSGNQALTNYTITAGNTTGSTPTTISIGISTGVATKLIFTSTPAGKSYISQTAFSPAITVIAQDANGVLVSNFTSPVTFSLAGSPAGAQLTGTLTKNAVNGITTFSDLKANTIGTNYVAKATATSLTATPNTAAFTIALGPPSQIAFTSFTPVGRPSSCVGPFQLTTYDAGMNVSKNNSATPLTISLSQSGSALFASNSNCNGTAINQVSVPAGQSVSDMFYIFNATAQSTTITAAGTGSLQDTVVSNVHFVTGDTLAAGETFTCAIFNLGIVKCWGNNASGQLGNGTNTQSLIPVQVSGINSAILLAAGQNHACALLSAGTVSCWGLNTFGQLGNNTVVNRNAPTAVVGLTNAISITAGANFTCSLIAGGSVKCWGQANYGQLGHNSTTNSTGPVSVNGISTALSVSAGGYHACATLANQTAVCWGGNSNGALGNSSTNSIANPVAVTGLSNAIKIFAGGGGTSDATDFSCAVRNTGAMHCWGYGVSGTLGNGSSGTSVTAVSAPASNAVSGITNPTLVSLGTSHACAVINGAVRCWGSNTSGELGNGIRTATATATPVVASGISTAYQLSVASTHTCAAVTTTGTQIEFKCWGKNNFGQLGTGNTTDKLVP